MTGSDTRAESARTEEGLPQDAPAQPGASPPPGVPRAPQIAVRLFAGAAAEFGADATTVRARNAGELVEALTTGATAEAARVIGRSSLLVDGVACTDLDRALEPGTRVDVLPPFAGG